MKRYLMGFAALTLLAGCASVADLRAKRPVAIRTTPKESSAVAGCIRAAWDAQRIGVESNGASVAQESAVWIVVSPPRGYPAEVAEVSAIGPNASQVKFFAQPSVDFGDRTSKRLSAIDTCM